MKVSQTIAVLVSSFLLLGMMTLSNELALAQSGGGGEARLSASMVSGAASGKADYRERGNHRRLNVEAKDLPSTTPFIPADIERQITISASRIASEIDLKRGQHRTARYEVSTGLEQLGSEP
jgi:hypothetical protein